MCTLSAECTEHKPTALGIPYLRPVAYHFDGAEALQQSLFSLFALTFLLVWLALTTNLKIGVVHGQCRQHEV